MGLESVQSEMTGLTRKLLLSADLNVLERAWQMEVGALGGVVRLVALDRAVLVVEALSSAAMQEIVLRKRELIRRMNKHFPEPFIQQMTVRMSDGR